MRFIHLADVRLGARPDAGHSWSDDRGQELYDSFRRMVKYAGDNSIDYIFITGGLFAHVPDEEELSWLDETLLSLKDTKVIYVPGASDPIRPGAALEFFPFKSQIYVAGKNAEKRKKEESISFDLDKNKHINIYCIFCRDEKQDISGSPSLKGDTLKDINILLTWNADRQQLGRLRRSGYTYVGAGGSVQYEMISKNTIYYSGIFEPTAPSETGKHGFLEGSIYTDSDEEKQRGTKPGIRFVNFSSCQYKTINYPVTKYMTSMEIAEDLITLMKKEGEENIYTINLIRDSKCQKAFEIEKLFEFEHLHILDINGEEYNRNSYEEYVRANRNNAFGKLLEQLYDSDPLVRDGAKMAVELIISRSEINSRKSNRLYDKTYNEAKRQALQRLHTKKQVLSDTPEMQEYEAVRKKLSANENVAARLNETWAKERQMEILLAASKSAYEQLPGRHRHDWIRNGIRYGIIPFIIFCMVCITWIPFNLSHGNYLQNIGSYVAGLLTLGIIIVAAGYLAGYYAAKLKDTRNKGEKGLNTELKHLENLIQSREGQLLELRKSRRNYQLLLDERKELLEEINEKERRAEKLYYEIKIIDKACQALGEKDNSAN